MISLINHITSSLLFQKINEHSHRELLKINEHSPNNFCVIKKGTCKRNSKWYTLKVSMNLWQQNSPCGSPWFLMVTTVLMCGPLPICRFSPFTQRKVHNKIDCHLLALLFPIAFLMAESYA